MVFLQFFLTFLAFIAINPAGVSRGDVFAEPKLAVALVGSVVNYIIVIPFWIKHRQIVNNCFFVENLRWSSFLVCATVATIAARNPLDSLIGSEITRNGLLFWVIVVQYSISNGLVLSAYPRVLKVQAAALVIAGVLCAFVTGYQVINPYFDFSFHQYPLGTKTLLNGMSIGNQPIGFFDHQGINSCFLAVALVGAVTFASQRLLPWAWLVTPAIASALVATERRAAIIAVTVSLLFLFKEYLRKHVLVVCAIVLGVTLIVVQFSLERHVRPIPNVTYSQREQFFRNTSAERSVIWGFYLKKSLESPLIGHGFNSRSGKWANQGALVPSNGWFETVFWVGFD